MNILGAVNFVTIICEIDISFFGLRLGEQNLNFNCIYNCVTVGTAKESHKSHNAQLTLDLDNSAIN